MATKENWKDVIRTNYTELLISIETEFGFFGDLRKLDVFNDIALHLFEDCKNTTETIYNMLKTLLRKDFKAFTNFCTALELSGQGNVVQDYLSCIKDVSSKEQPISDVPCDPSRLCAITPAMSECLKKNWNKLIININFDEGLLVEIEKLSIFTQMQHNNLREIYKKPKRTNATLKLLEKGSEKQFLDFCEALRNNNQPFVVAEYMTWITKPEPVTQHATMPAEEVSGHKQTVTTPPSVPPVAKIAPPPIPANDIPVADICFSLCNEEILNDINDKVQKGEAYKFNNKPRGRALIINNKYFVSPELGFREGSEKDSSNLHTLFKLLHFDTEVHSDLSAEQILNVLTKESQEDCHKNYDMFVLFLMSHGINGEIFSLDGSTVKTKDIAQLFGGKNCPNLVGKPKLIFIQACQGELKTSGVISTQSDGTVTDSPDEITWMEELAEKLRQEDDINLSVPLEKPATMLENDAVPDESRVHEMADMALLYATVEDHVSWRDKNAGSFFVQSLVDVFTKKAHEMDLVSMMTEVFKMLHEKEIIVAKNRYKQIGEQRHTLRRMVYLLPS